MTHFPAPIKNSWPHCGRCACCGMPAAEIEAALDRAVRRILPFSLDDWRVWRRCEGVNSLRLQVGIVRTAFTEAHLIRQEFRAVLEQAKEHVVC